MSAFIMKHVIYRKHKQPRPVGQKGEKHDVFGIAPPFNWFVSLRLRINAIN